MYIIKDEELKNIQGGISFWTCIGIGGVVSFLAGFLDGFTRPLKCN